MITIKKYENSFLDEAKQLKITEKQKKYVDINFDEIIKMTEQYSYTEIFLIFNDNTIVGFAFFILDDTGDMDLLKFMIDYRYQGKGYGKDSLKLLLDLIKTNVPKEEIWLSVHPENTTAISLYKKIGFFRQQTEYNADDEIFFKYTYKKQH